MDYPGLLHSGDSGMATYRDQLIKTANTFSAPDKHLKHLLGQPDRFQSFSSHLPGFFFDFSRQRLDQDSLDLLFKAAGAAHALDRFKTMAQGGIVNTSENRAALHTAARGSGSDSITAGGMDVCRPIQAVKQEIKAFCAQVHGKKITSASGAAFTHAVVVGIGGSYLGCEFVYKALASATPKYLDLIFLANVDIDAFAGVTAKINPETTLWIVISKSYTTTETMANLNLVKSWLNGRNLNPQNHIVTVTAKGSPGDDPGNPVLASFSMFDFIGGRYSVSSAVGGVPLGLAFGWQVFETFLDGCRTMDTHTLDSPAGQNIPLTAALISIWNTVFLKYPAQAIIPYASRLSKLAPHIQQLYMESLGKSVSCQGQPLVRPAGTIIFGEPGTNAQHSFFQLAHQGPAFPVEFIGVVTPGFKDCRVLSKGVTNHQELWANLLAQARALALGQDHDNPARRFEGNRPSSIIVLDDLGPQSVGQLLAFYEARTVLEGFILGVNPFDQFGVELGKTMAADLRETMAAASQTKFREFDRLEKADQYYLNRLFGRI